MTFHLVYPTVYRADLSKVSLKKFNTTLKPKKKNYIVCIKTFDFNKINLKERLNLHRALLNILKSTEKYQKNCIQLANYLRI